MSSRKRALSRGSFNLQSPLQCKTDPIRSVAPYSPRTPQARNNSSSSPFREDLPSNFSQLDLTPKNDMNVHYLSVADSLFNYSIGIETRLDVVLSHILKYRNCAPLENHTFEPFVSLIDSGAACPADCQYFLLTIPAMMIDKGMLPSDSVLNQLIAKAKNLLSPGICFVTFGNDQKVPRQHIKEMIALFESLLRDKGSQKQRTFTYGASRIEEYVALQGVVDKYSENQKKKNDPELVRSASIERFLSDHRGIEERISDGKIRQKKISREEFERIQKYAHLFVSWETAYRSVQQVWEVMKIDPQFEVNVLISMMPITFADFTVSGLKQFAVEEGIIIPELPSPQIYLD